MKQILEKYNIDTELSPEEVKECLQDKQIEYMARLDNVSNVKRRIELEESLDEIESTLSKAIMIIKKNQNAMLLDDEDQEDFSHLKNIKKKEKQETISYSWIEQKEKIFDEVEALLKNNDFTRAFQLVEKLADEGDSKAQYDLGEMYANGQGVEQNNEEAVYWYRKSADQGYERAQNNLGEMYYYGQGVEENQEKAVYWYRKSADQGDVDAQCNLGYMYANGQGVEQNNEKAVYWYRKSADQGNAYAQYNLGIRYENGHGVEQNNEKAKFWYNKALSQGSSHA